MTQFSTHLSVFYKYLTIDTTRSGGAVVVVVTRSDDWTRSVAVHMRPCHVSLQIWNLNLQRMMRFFPARRVWPHIQSRRLH